MPTCRSGCRTPPPWRRPHRADRAPTSEAPAPPWPPARRAPRPRARRRRRPDESGCWPSRACASGRRRREGRLRACRRLRPEPPRLRPALRRSPRQSRECCRRSTRKPPLTSSLPPRCRSRRTVSVGHVAPPTLPPLGPKRVERPRGSLVASQDQGGPAAAVDEQVIERGAAQQPMVGGVNDGERVPQLTLRAVGELELEPLLGLAARLEYAHPLGMPPTDVVGPELGRQ